MEPKRELLEASSPSSQKGCTKEAEPCWDTLYPKESELPLPGPSRESLKGWLQALLQLSKARARLFAERTFCLGRSALPCYHQCLGTAEAHASTGGHGEREGGHGGCSVEKTTKQNKNFIFSSAFGGYWFYSLLWSTSCFFLLLINQPRIFSWNRTQEFSGVISFFYYYLWLTSQALWGLCASGRPSAFLQHLSLNLSLTSCSEG